MLVIIMLSSYVNTVLGANRLPFKLNVKKLKTKLPSLLRPRLHVQLPHKLHSPTIAPALSLYPAVTSVIQQLGTSGLTLSLVGIGVFGVQSAHADSILGIELSPAICKLNPYRGNLRQCIEGNPMTVNFYRINNQPCANSRYSISPLQENIISKVIPDSNTRKNMWQQYGRCSGLNSSNYFRQITALAGQLKLPKELSSGRSYRFVSTGFSRQLLSLNPGMKPTSFNLFCQKNGAGQSVLTYVNVCYDNSGHFGQCTTRANSCPGQFLIDGNY